MANFSKRNCLLCLHKFHYIRALSSSWSYGRLFTTTICAISAYLAITSKVVSLNPTHGEVYSIQHHVMKFFSKKNPPRYNCNTVECGVKHHNYSPLYHSIYLIQSLQIYVSLISLSILFFRKTRTYKERLV